MNVSKYLLMGALLVSSAVLLAPPKKAGKKPAVQLHNLGRECSAEGKAACLEFVRAFDARVTSKLIDVTMRKQLNLLEAKLAGYEPGKIKVKFNINTSLGDMLNAWYQNLGTAKHENVKVSVNPGPRTTDITIEMSFRDMLQQFKSGNGVSGILDWPRMLGVEVDRDTLELKSIESFPEVRACDVHRALAFVTEEHFAANVGNARVQSILAFTLNEVNILMLDDVTQAEMNPDQKVIKNLVEALVKKLSDLVKKLNGDQETRRAIYAAAAELRAMLDAEFGFSGAAVAAAEEAPAVATRKRGRN